MSKYERIETVLESKTKNYDSKHILNLAPNKIIPNDVLERLRKDGLTIEQIDRLQDEGYPVCHYETQITIHGIVENELSAKRTANGYVTLVRNQNKSLGVRWIAVDEGKRKRIFTLLRHYGWKHQQSSSYDYYCKICSFTKESMEMLKSEEARIDKSLFFGRTDLYTAALYGMRYIILECHLNGIYERNIKSFVESMTGVSYEECELRNQEFCDKQKAEWEERERKAKEAEEKNRLRREEWKKNNPMPEGFFEVEGSQLEVGDIICSLKENSEECFWLFTLVYKAGASLCEKLCDEDGNDKGMRGHAIRFPKRKFFVKRKETPKPMQKASETARKEPSRIEIKDYKNAILVTGDTKPIKETLKSARGMWNKALQGWIFPKSKRGEVERLLS